MQWHNVITTCNYWSLTHFARASFWSYYSSHSHCLSCAS